MAGRTGQHQVVQGAMQMRWIERTQRNADRWSECNQCMADSGSQCSFQVSSWFKLRGSGQALGLTQVTGMGVAGGEAGADGEGEN